MDKIINSPYNINAVARVDSDNIVHNHIYHHCPIGRVDDNNFVYDNNNNTEIENYEYELCEVAKDKLFEFMTKREFSQFIIILLLFLVVILLLLK